MVLSESSPQGIQGGQINTGIGFYPAHFTFPYNFHSTDVIHSYFIYLPTIISKHNSSAGSLNTTFLYLFGYFRKGHESKFYTKQCFDIDTYVALHLNVVYIVSAGL